MMTIQSTGDARIHPRAIRTQAYRLGLFATPGQFLAGGEIVRILGVNYAQMRVLVKHMRDRGVLAYALATGLYQVLRPMDATDVTGGARGVSSAPSPASPTR